MEVLKIAIVADDQTFSGISGKTVIDWIRVESFETLINYANADILIFLGDEKSIQRNITVPLPLIVNAVYTPLHELNLNGNICRINGWPGFLERNTWELSGSNHKVFNEFFKRMEKETLIVADEPGFVSVRILAMIINEAYFAFSENVSSREEIDIAMKLGTNYPLGPFEWSQKIGIQRIYKLLEKLSISDIKYKPAELLKKEAQLEHEHNSSN